MPTETPDYVHWFRHSSPYINAHRGRTFVIMVDGEALEGPGFSNFIQDLALLNSLGVRLVLVQDARPQIEARVATLSQPCGFHQGLRITDNETLMCVHDALGRVRIRVEAQLSMGLANSPMHGSRIRVCSGNWVTARPLGVIDGVDYQHTGEVRRIDHEAINRQLAEGAIALLPPLGYSATGETFNLRTEDVAVAAAAELGADKLIALGPYTGARDPQGRLVREMTASEAQQRHRDGQLGEVSEPHLLAACRACRAGLARAHLVSYREDGALLQELFTRDGAGTLIGRSPYEQLRGAGIDDVGGLLELIRPLEEQGILVRRSRELLENEVGQFTVLERDGMIVGCAALYPSAGTKLGELACVAVHPEYRAGERGQLLLGHIEQRARSLGLEQLFVLTTRAQHWFREQGFQPSQLSALPGQRQALYNYQRNSKVFIKSLLQ